MGRVGTVGGAVVCRRLPQLVGVGESPARRGRSGTSRIALRSLRTRHGRRRAGTSGRPGGPWDTGWSRNRRCGSGGPACSARPRTRCDRRRCFSGRSRCADRPGDSGHPGHALHAADDARRGRRRRRQTVPLELLTGRVQPRCQLGNDGALTGDRRVLHRRMLLQAPVRRLHRVQGERHERSREQHEHPHADQRNAGRPRAGWVGRLACHLAPFIVPYA